MCVGGEMKTITIPYDEYLELEKCKKVIENMRDSLKDCELKPIFDDGQKTGTIYCNDILFEVLDILDTKHLEIWRTYDL